MSRRGARDMDDIQSGFNRFELGWQIARGARVGAQTGVRSLAAHLMYVTMSISASAAYAQRGA
jgi:hypothetical protein